MSSDDDLRPPHRAAPPHPGLRRPPRRHREQPGCPPGPDHRRHLPRAPQHRPVGPDRGAADRCPGHPGDGSAGRRGPTARRHPAHPRRGPDRLRPVGRGHLVRRCWWSAAACRGWASDCSRSTWPSPGATSIRCRPARAIATLSVSTAIGAGLGYPITAMVAQLANVHAAYWFGAIVVAAALACSVLVLPPRTPAAPLAFDSSGAVLLSLAVTGVSVVLSEGGNWGWTSPRTCDHHRGKPRGAGRLGAPRAPVPPSPGQPPPPGRPVGADGRRGRVPHVRVDVPGGAHRGGVHPDPTVDRIRVRRLGDRVGPRPRPRCRSGRSWPVACSSPTSAGSGCGA